MPFYSNLIPIFNDKKKDSCSLCQWYLMTSNQLVIITNWLFIYKMMMNVPDIQKWKKVNSINFQREKGAQSVWETPKSLSLATGQGSPSDHSCLISCHNATSLTPWKRWKASRQLVTPAIFPSWKGKKVP